MSHAPIALFVYSRLHHTRLTVEALLKNSGAKFSDLIIFSDDAKTPDKRTSVEEVRKYLKTIEGFRSIKIHYRPYNYGLSKSIIDGVTQALQAFDRIIVLEDDLITSPHFISYMNGALDKYANDERIVSIHGYVCPIKQKLPETFFLRGADCWGWATWRRGWELFNSNGQDLLDGLVAKKMIREFDFNGAYSFSNMLREQINGRNDSWAIRWHASAFLLDRLTLYPGRSLVQNIGHDNSGTHCVNESVYDVQLSDIPINLDAIKIESCTRVWHEFEKFYRVNQDSLMKKIFRKVQRLLKNLLDYQ